MSAGVLASGAGTNLQALLDDGLPVVAVASDVTEAPALARARAAGVEAAVFARGAFADRAARDVAMADWLGGRGVELVVLAGYMALVTPPFLARFPDRVVNVHPSLLPAFPGLRAIEQALEYGAKVTGVTVHLVDEGVDTGPVIAQRALDVGATTDPAELHARLRPLEHALLRAAVRALLTGRVVRDPANPRRLTIAPERR